MKDKVLFVVSHTTNIRTKIGGKYKMKSKLPKLFYYVLLTVHLGIILVKDQLDAQFFFLICLFQFSTCFEQPRAHHQKNKLYQYNFWYMSLCKWPSGKQVSLHTYTE
jgi:hypothetical protein